MTDPRALHALFSPQVVAVVGASRDPTTLGHRIVRSLVTCGFCGRVYPINPHAATVLDLPAFPSIGDLPERADLAVICVPRQAVRPVLDACADAGLSAAVVISGGFAETDAAGRTLQQELAERLAAGHMRVVGPNCVGLVNADPAVRLNTTFTPLLPPPGRVALCSQSGALGLLILASAQRRQLGFSKFVSVGNEMDVSAADLIDYLGQDADTDVILLYAESIARPQAWLDAAQRVARHKPIVLLKAGRTRAGLRAAGSHTAALATRETAVNALCRKAGIIRVDTLDELMDTARVFTDQPLPTGRRVGIVTNAGGPAVLCSDACETAGLAVAELSEPTAGRLGQLLGGPASLRNPVDMLASATPHQYRQAIAILLASGEVDAVVPIYVPVEMTADAAFLTAIDESMVAARSAGAMNRPVLACVMTSDATTRHFPTPDAPARVLSRLAAYAEWRRLEPGPVAELPDVRAELACEVCRRAVERSGRDGTWLDHGEIAAVCDAMGLPALAGTMVQDSDAAVRAARELGFPVVLKAISPQLVHKTESATVQLHLPDESSVRQAFASIASRLGDTAAGRSAPHTMLVQPTFQGPEFLVGGIRDPAFGPLVAFGLGGPHVELLADTAWRLAPLADRDAAEMLREIRSGPLLQGYRGRPASDLEAIRDLLRRVSWLLAAIHAVAEIDMNPVYVLPAGQGCCIADARIRVQATTGRAAGHDSQ